MEAPFMVLHMDIRVTDKVVGKLEARPYTDNQPTLLPHMLNTFLMVMDQIIAAHSTELDTAVDSMALHTVTKLMDRAAKLYMD